MEVERSCMKEEKKGAGDSNGGDESSVTRR